MGKLEELEQLLDDNKGVITTELARKHNIHREYLSKYVMQGKLERIAYGVYITPDVWEDKMLILQLRRKKMIYSHGTALYLHELTDREPLKYAVTVPKGYNTSKLKEEGLEVHVIKIELFELGKCEKQTVFGNSVRTYDRERTICDVARDRNNMDPAIVTEALKKYTQRKDKNIHKLLGYAERFSIKSILHPYLEVLL